MSTGTPAPLPPPGYWYCGECGSIIPLIYWHWCKDGETHTGPSHGDEPS